MWAPTGLAIAALFLFGLRLWPAVAVGALLTNATSGVSIGTAAGIAVGNTLEAVAGSFLLRWAGVHAALERARDVLALVVASLVATTVSATIGTLTLLVAGNNTARTYGSDWLLWWFGDVIGALLVTPLLLVWVRGRQFERRLGRRLDASEQGILRERFVSLGGDQLGDVVLDFDGAALSGWLVDPAAR